MFTNDPVTGDPISGVDNAVTGLGGDDSDSFLAQLGGLFSTIGTTVSGAIKATSGPATPRPISPGTYYNPNTGQVQTVGAFGTLGGGSSLLLILGFGLVAILLLRK